MLNIVIVEDNQPLRESLIEVLSAAPYRAFGFESSEAFLSGCSLNSINIVVLDLNLPGQDGVSLAKHLRSEMPEIGILMLTARNNPSQIKDGYDSGADIYIVKPSSSDEFLAAIRALARRLLLRRPNSQKAVFEAMLRTISGPDGKVELSESEANLLAHFLRAEDNRRSRSDIASLFNDGETSKSPNVEVRILRLRKKLFDAGFPMTSISVVRGWGYKLSLEIEVI